MRPYLSLLWTTREGTSFKGSFPASGFCPLQSRVGDPGVWSLWKCNWACIQHAWTAARPQRMPSVSTLKPLLWGGQGGVPTAFPVPSSGVQGWRFLSESHGEWGRDHSELEDGTSQNQGAEKWRWVGSLVLSRRCQLWLHRSVSVTWMLGGSRFGFWDRFSECYLGKGVPSCLEVTKIKLRSDRENEWFY